MIRGYRSKDLYYDNVNMYLKGHDGILTVPFEKVKKVQLTLSDATIMGLKFYQYKIQYMDADGSECEFHFWTATMSTEIDNFEREVKNVNHDLIVEHWAAS